jgi:hypothetical protein
MKRSISIFCIVNLSLFLVGFLAIQITRFYVDKLSKEDRYSIINVNAINNASSYDYPETDVGQLPDIGSVPTANVCTADCITEKMWLDNDKAGHSMIGAQYLIEFKNITDKAFTDWKLTFVVPEGYVIDFDKDVWDGKFTANNNLLMISSIGYNSRIEPGTMRSVGFVMLTNGRAYKLKEMIIMYHQEFLLKDTLSYHLCLWGLAALVLFDIIWIIATAYYWQYRKKAEHDREIIAQALNAFASIIDAKDEYTKGHSTRVAAYAKEIARRMGMNEDDQRRLCYIGLLHDIGKVGIPDGILGKPGPLTPEERELVKRHVVIGGDILKDFTSVKGIELGARYHHERYDGKGYCEGIAGESIPIEARIICVADSFDAMSSARCYRPKASLQYTIMELRNNLERQFDPVVAQHMLDMIDDGFAPIKSLDDIDLDL